MTMDCAMESMELSHGEYETHILMADDLEESVDTLPSDGFAALTNEHSSTVITSSNTEFSSPPSNGINKKVSKSRQKKSRKGKATLTINEYYIRKTSGNTVINLPTNNDSVGADFYTTPDNTTHKGDGSTERVFSEGNPLDRETKGFGAKTTSRGLDFGGVPNEETNEEDELSKILVPVAPQTGTRHSFNQARIPFHLRKRRIKDKASLSRTKRWHHMHDGNCEHTHRTENYLFVDRNDGCLIVGNNNNICFKKEIKKELEGAEGVEADSTYPSISPEKTLKVPADENSENFMSMLQDVINCLHPLRDSGRYEEFYTKAKEFAEVHSSEQHIQILLLIEQSITLSYQKEFAKSKDVIDEQLRKIPEPGVKMKNVLLAYCHVHLTGLSRRQNRLTEADKHVNTARQNEEFIPFGIVRAFVAYEEASNLTKMLSLMNVDKEEPSAWQIKKEDARRILRECISFSKRIHNDNSAIYLQRGHFCLVKLALMNLNCRTKISRTQLVDEESIFEAEQCINQMQECDGDMSAALSVQFYTAKGDLSLRKQDFLQARRFAQQALDIAENNNIRLEIKAIRERLEDINLLT